MAAAAEGKGDDDSDEQDLPDVRPLKCPWKET